MSGLFVSASIIFIRKCSTGRQKFMCLSLSVNSVSRCPGVGAKTY